MGNFFSGVALVLLFAALVAIIVRNVVIVPQAMQYVVERLGSFYAVWDTGLHIKIPFIDRIANKVTMKEQVIDFAPQSVITKDNVTMQIDSVVYLTFSDAKLLTYGAERPISAVENLTATTLRNIVGSMDLDSTLTGRDEINSQMRETLDLATDPWGIKIIRVEVKNIDPPKDVKDAMEKQMRAEREKREAILQSEGRKESQINIAEGEKRAAVLAAEAKAETIRMQAEAEAAAIKTKADAEAQAIRIVQNATADGLSAINESLGTTEAVIRYESLKTLETMADGKATKIIIPSELQGLAGTLTGLAEAVSTDEKPQMGKALKPASEE